ncbi:O-antigen ligase family protein [Staphylococcus warneri]|uniref:O-antigen ligase family protein n=1 Tax=Staphylococcus warneri TaxID=1292 RepID=UPI00325FFDC0
MNDIQTNYRPGIKVVTLVILYIYISILIGSINAIDSSIATLGLISLGLVLLFTNIGNILMLFNHKLHFVQIILLGLTILLVLTGLLAMLRDNEISDLINILQLIMCIGFCIYLSFLKLDYNKMKVANIITAGFIIIHFLIWIVSGFPRMFSSFYPNPNLVGPYMFYTSFFLILGIKYSKFRILYILLLIASGLLIIASDSRSILVSIFLTILMYFAWKFITKTIAIRIILFGALIVASLIFIYVYPHLPEYRFYLPLEQWMLSHTGKSIMSGRNDIWVLLVDLVNQKPYLGYGMNTVSSDLINVDKSAHNLYLNTLLQIGYIGFVCFILLMFVIWMKLTSEKNDFIVRLSGAFMIGILVHENFEITLFQNQLSIGMLQWMILGIGLSKVIHSKKSVDEQYI